MELQRLPESCLASRQHSGLISLVNMDTVRYFRVYKLVAFVSQEKIFYSLLTILMQLLPMNRLRLSAGTD